MTKAERQLMREATACEWNAWFGKDAMETCHLQGTDENEALAIDGCQRSSQMGHTIARHWISRSQPYHSPSRCTNSVWHNTCNFNLVLSTTGVWAPWMCAWRYVWRRRRVWLWFVTHWSLQLRLDRFCGFRLGEAKDPRPSTLDGIAALTLVRKTPRGEIRRMFVGTEIGQM